MEKQAEEKNIKPFQYSTLGKEKQVLNVVLAPGQAIYVNDTNVICCSEGFSKEKVKVPFWGEPKEHTPSHSKFINTSEDLAYMTINSNGGRVIAINSMLQKGMLFHEDYVLAHTLNVSLKKLKYCTYSIIASNHSNRYKSIGKGILL